MVQWEKEQANMSPVHDSYMRMLFVGMLQDREFDSVFREINPEVLAKAKGDKTPLSIQSELLKTAI